MEVPMNAILRYTLAVAAAAIAAQATAQIVFYEREGFEGRSFTTEKQIGNFERYGFNDRASSVIVLRDRWEACEDVRFHGRCIVLRPGRYPSLAAMGLNNRVSSVRTVRSTADLVIAATQITITDFDQNVITYRGNAVTSQLERDGGTGFLPLADNVSNLQFNYLQNNGTSTAATAASEGMSLRQRAGEVTGDVSQGLERFPQ